MGEVISLDQARAERQEPASVRLRKVISSERFQALKERQRQMKERRTPEEP